MTGKDLKLDVAAIRRDFPILSRKINGNPLVYFDNASTTQKPRSVTEALVRFHGNDNSNVHRGAHTLNHTATLLYNSARETVAEFINASDPAEVIFTSGSTASINLVAWSFGRAFINPGDEILVSNLEHHSNIVPWQMLCDMYGARLRVIPISDDGQLDLDALRQRLSARTRLVAVTHVSNALGVINPVHDIIGMAHEAGAKVLVDGAQWVAHGPINVRELDADFYVFSGHKVYGPTGIGVLYGKRELLENMPPMFGGGDMIESVTFMETKVAELPLKFEAGTPNIEGAIGLAEAIRYVNRIGLKKIAQHEGRLLQRVTEGLARLRGVRVFSNVTNKAAIVSFVVDDPPLNPLDIGVQLDLKGIAVRTGHHCCQPLMQRMGSGTSARVSFALYNTEEEVDFFIATLADIIETARSNAAKAPATESSSVYPQATAPDVRKAAARIERLFDMLPDWEARYLQIIDFGKAVPPMPLDLKTSANLVPGCQSTVYLDIQSPAGAEDKLLICGYSDADIVTGLIGILQRVFSGQKAIDIVEFNVPAFLSRLGLDSNLSMTRRNGLSAMIQRIKTTAETCRDKAFSYSKTGDDNAQPL